MNLFQRIINYLYIRYVYLPEVKVKYDKTFHVVQMNDDEPVVANKEQERAMYERWKGHFPLH